jgi:hypothetical protein
VPRPAPLAHGFLLRHGKPRSGAEGIRTPDLRRAKADRYILARLSTSGDHPYLQAFCGTAGSGVSAAYCPVPPRLQYGCSTRPSLGSCCLICGAFRFSLTLRSRLPPGQTLANCEPTRCSLPLRCTLISLTGREVRSWYRWYFGSATRSRKFATNSNFQVTAKIAPLGDAQYLLPSRTIGN